jgi:hypothetical protein
MDDKGKGPVSEQLKVPPSDLTALARDNNGLFPTNAVYEVIYGSETISAHDIREMPIWGERFNPIVDLPHRPHRDVQRFRICSSQDNVPFQHMMDTELHVQP